MAFVLPHLFLRRVVAALFGNNCMTKATTGASATLPTAAQGRACEAPVFELPDSASLAKLTIVSPGGLVCQHKEGSWSGPFS
jgi:hypothetical protein